MRVAVGAHGLDAYYFLSLGPEWRAGSGALASKSPDFCFSHGVAAPCTCQGLLEPEAVVEGLLWGMAFTVSCLQLGLCACGDGVGSLFLASGLGLRSWHRGDMGPRPLTRYQCCFGAPSVPGQACTWGREPGVPQLPGIAIPMPCSQSSLRATFLFAVLFSLVAPRTLGTAVKGSWEALSPSLAHRGPDEGSCRPCGLVLARALAGRLLTRVLWFLCVC